MEGLTDDGSFGTFLNHAKETLLKVPACDLLNATKDVTEADSKDKKS